MLYLGFQAHSDIMDRLRAGAGMPSTLGARVNGSHGLRYAAAACELFSKTRLTHERPSYGIKTIAVGEREVAVREEPVLKTPFGHSPRARAPRAAAQHLSDFRLMAMEGGVETRHLGNLREVLPDDPNRFQVVRLVERRERHKPLKLAKNDVVNEDRARISSPPWTTR